MWSVLLGFISSTVKRIPMFGTSEIITDVTDQAR